MTIAVPANCFPYNLQLVMYYLVHYLHSPSCWCSTWRSLTFTKAAVNKSSSKRLVVLKQKASFSELRMGRT